MSDDDDTPGTANAGWADSIAKILKTNKPKGKKKLVLSKAKKLTDTKKTKTKAAGFEVATADGDVKEEQVEVEDERIEETQPRKKVGSCLVTTCLTLRFRGKKSCPIYVSNPTSSKKIGSGLWRK